MPGANDIRAGRAFVEVYADKTRLDRALKTISADLKAFGAGISSLGKKFMVLGAGIAAPLLAATKHFMTFGSALYDMSARTGLSTNALSELGYAAEQSGASLADVETSVKRMQRAISEAKDGPLKALQGMAPEKQFTAVAEAINAIPDPTARAAKALEIFGRGGASLLPMLQDMKALRAEAVRLGLSDSKEQAAAADALGDAWDKCKSIFKAAAISIGSALAPTLTGLAERVAKGVSAVRSWLSEHKALIITAFAVGAAALAAGAGLFVLGKAITFTGVAVGGLLAVGKLATAMFGTLQAAVLALANPFVLVGVAIAGVGAYVLYATGQLGKAATWISQTFATILAEVKDTFGAIAESMAAGDLVGATKVGLALMKLEWTRFIGFVGGLWGDFKLLYEEAVGGLAIGLINASATMQTIWADLMNWMAKTWVKWANGSWVQAVSDKLILAYGLITNMTDREIADWQNETHKLMAENRRPENIAAMDAETAGRKAEIERERQGRIDQIGGDILNRQKQNEKDKQRAQDEVESARKDLEDARRAARERAKASGAGSFFDFSGAMKSFPQIDLEAAGGKARSSVRGTFSASAVAGLGVGGVQERIARAAEKTFRFAGEQTTILREVRDGIDKLNLEAAP